LAHSQMVTPLNLNTAEKCMGYFIKPALSGKNKQ